MGEGGETQKQAVDESLVEFLTVFIDYLLAAGVTYGRFASIARLAYFLAASTRARFGNERLNQSAVAAITGLTRVQVRQFAKQTNPAPARVRDRLDSVIEGWTTDASFTSNNYEPRRLRATGRGATFHALVTKYGGDVPSRSMLREMQRHGYVSIKNGLVTLKPDATRAREQFRLRQASRALAELLKSPAENARPRAPLRILNMEVAYPPTSDKGRILLQKSIAENLEAFLSRVKTAGISAAIDSPSKKKKGRLTRTRVLLMTEDWGQ